MPKPSSIILIITTTLALLGFAANSILTRLALSEPSIDATSFTGARLVSGALMLLAIMVVRHRRFNHQWVLAGSWRSATLLFVYAAAFSFAYIQLETATGALILFGTVQLTMIGVSLWQGLRLRGLEQLGIVVALASFLYLVLPGLATPSVTGFLLMTISGLAWAGYTLAGRHSTQPLTDTTANFVRAAPLVLVLYLPFAGDILIGSRGFWLAVASGALASGVGYALWYAALPALSRVQAGILQLLVPLLAAWGGVVFVAEPLSLRLILAAAGLLGGVALVLVRKQA
ncbi:MAG: DMT family transporter [Saccharospirillum sp.]|nr:DMT family transporter [Saccharospirillum sp.]